MDQARENYPNFSLSLWERAGVRVALKERDFSFLWNQVNSCQGRTYMFDKRFGYWILWIGVLAGFGTPVSQGLSESERQEGFVPLFNGRDLAGWHVMGHESAWVIEDGVLHALPGLGGGYIQSEGSYENFILRLEYKTSPNANSGVFFHIPQHGRQSRVGGEIQIHDSYGKEPTLSSAGALYDKVPPLSIACRPAGEWNELEIWYEHPRLKVTLNGTVVQDLDVSQDERIRWRKRFGPIGLQEHGNHVWFRDVRIKDLGGTDQASWIPLFNNKNLDGWRKAGDASWFFLPSRTIIEIENNGADQSLEFPKRFERWNVLGGAQWKIEESCVAGHYGRGFLVSEGQYQDFHLWAYVKTSPEATGGIWIRWQSEREPGILVTLLNDRHEKHKTGSLVTLGRSVNDVNILAAADGKYTRDEEWFPLQIIAQGSQATVVVNGAVVAKYDPIPVRPGNIALSVFTRSDTVISLRDVRIQELK